MGNRKKISWNTPSEKAVAKRKTGQRNLLVDKN
jgi:hypothetical protein